MPPYCEEHRCNYTLRGDFPDGPTLRIRGWWSCPVCSPSAVGVGAAVREPLGDKPVLDLMARCGVNDLPMEDERDGDEG